MRKYYLLFLFFASLLCAHGQQAGSFYTNFASRGWDTLQFAPVNMGYAWQGATQVLRQADKFVVLIQVADKYSVLARYNSNGSPDFTFGTNGYSVPINLYEAKKAAIQTIDGDPRIVVVGTATTPLGRDFGVTRFKGDGSVDRSFGTNGRVTTNFTSTEGNNTDEADNLAIQSDNKIVVVGLTNNSQSDFACARYNPDGSLDASGFSGGKITVSFGPDVDYVNAVAIQNDGSIVLAGTDNADFLMARLNADGSLDGGFGNGGLVRTDFNGQSDEAKTIAIQPDNKIILGGQTWSNSYGWDLALARYNTDGSLDAGNFGSGGRIMVDVSGWSDEINAMLLQPDGNIVVTGAFNTYIGIARFTPSGTLDNSFGSNGAVMGDFGYSPDTYSIALLSNSDFIISGQFYLNYALLQYDTYGNLVTTFGTGGTVSGYYNQGMSAINYGIALQNISGEDKLVVGGVGLTGEWGDFGVANYNANGSFNTAFATTGKLTTNIQGNDIGKAVAVQGDDKVLLAGTSVEAEGDFGSFTVARYTTSGVPDPMFGYEGKAYASLRDDDYANAMALQPDGKILLAGKAQTKMVSEIGNYFYALDFGIVRFKPDGTPDSTFGTNGVVVTDLNGYDDVINAIAIQNDGKIVVAGSTTGTNGNSDIALARYTTEGALDNSFGRNGKVVADINGLDDVANAVLVQNDGRILVAGTASNTSGYSDMVLLAYTSSGVPDKLFTNKGKVVTDFYGKNDFANTISLQADGKILVSGATETITAGAVQKDMAIARYTAKGVLDGSFGVNGKLSTDLGFAETINASVWKNDKLYITGSAEANAGFAYPSSYGLTAVYNTSLPEPALVSITSTSVVEGETANLLVTLSPVITSPVIVNYATKEGTAHSKGRYPDFKAMNGTLTIPAGESTAVLSIPTYNDHNTGQKYFTVNLTLPKAMQALATLGTGTATVTIQDAPSLYRVTTNPAVTALSAKVFPNPAAHYFTLKIEGGNLDPVSVRVLDVSGKLVEARTMMAANEMWRFGEAYAPGVYYAQVQQGSENVSVKLIKMAD